MGKSPMYCFSSSVADRPEFSAWWGCLSGNRLVCGENFKSGLQSGRAFTTLLLRIVRARHLPRGEFQGLLVLCSYVRFISAPVRSFGKYNVFIGVYLFEGASHYLWCIVFIGRFRGGGRRGRVPPPPPRPENLSISCSFLENLAILYVGVPPPGRLAPPPTGNPGSTPGVSLSMSFVFVNYASISAFISVFSALFYIPEGYTPFSPSSSFSVCT